MLLPKIRLLTALLLCLDCSVTALAQDASVDHAHGNAWYDKGEYDKAIADYSEAIRLNPKVVVAYNSLAWLLATCPDAKPLRRCQRRQDAALLLMGRPRFSMRFTSAIFV